MPISKKITAGYGTELIEEALPYDLGADFHPATKAHPELLVTDLQAIIERCQEEGFAILGGAPLEGYRRIFINDPFGNRLKLMQRVCT